MLVPFVIDTESVAPDPAWTPSILLSTHKSLLATWQRFGLLVHDGDQLETSELRKKIGELPPKILPLWLEMLEHLPAVPATNGWTGQVQNAHTCLQVIDEISNLAVVDDDTAEAEFDLSDEQLYVSFVPDLDLQVCRITSFEHAPFITDAIALGMQHIPAALPYADLWRTRFGCLARAPIKRVTIVDRFAYSQHYECPQHYLSGLERFLRLLDSEASGNRYATVYSAWTTELNEAGVTTSDIQQELNQVMHHLPSGNIKRLRVVMLPNSVFGQLHHDRFIRFENYVWDLGIGIKIFQGPSVPERCNANFNCCLLAPTYNDAVDELDRHKAAKEILA